MVCGVVACKDNNKVGGCSDAVLLAVAVARLLWECGVLVLVLWIGRGREEEREPPHGLYPDKNHSFLIPF